jgi:hypothetical protein
MENEMKTLEELHAHYKAVKARLDNPVKKVPAVRLVYPEPTVVYPDPLDFPVPPFVPDVVGEVGEPIAAPTATTDTPARKILMEVAEKHGMPLVAFRSKSRTMPFINLRHEACYRLSTELGFSLMQIGRLMGNRDHTTILNAIRRHKKILVEGYKPKTRTKSCVSNACVTKVETQAQNDHG